jgi:hypothetical protein
LSKSTQDAFVQAVGDYLFGLADDPSRRRFIHAARTFLALDPFVKTLSRAKRAKLLRAPIEEYSQELDILAHLADAVARLCATVVATVRPGCENGHPIGSACRQPHDGYKRN